MYRTILVGCDGSDEQADALALARALRRPDGTLVLVNAFPLYMAMTGPALALEYSQWLAERAEETVAAAAASLPADVPHETRTIASPSPAAGLNDLAEEIGADLIVLGRSERSFLADLAGRKTIQRLLHGAPCAIAVATPGQSSGAPAHIGVAYDGTPEADLALAAAFDLAQAASARVHLRWVFEPIIAAAGFVGVIDDDAIEQDMRTRLDAAAARAPEGVAVDADLLRGSPPWHVLLEGLPDVDLLVAGSRGFGPLHRALAGSTSSVLLKDGRTAVLVTPRPHPS